MAELSQIYLIPFLHKIWIDTDGEMVRNILRCLTRFGVVNCITMNRSQYFTLFTICIDLGLVSVDKVGIVNSAQFFTVREVDEKVKHFFIR